MTEHEYEELSQEYKRKLDVSDPHAERLCSKDVIMVRTFLGDVSGFNIRRGYDGCTGRIGVIEGMVDICVRRAYKRGVAHMQFDAMFKLGACDAIDVFNGFLERCMGKGILFRRFSL
jgi:hypothetical protein